MTPSPTALPKLPVARALWRCQPDFKTACAAWIYAGGAHHTGFSYSVTREQMEDFAEMAGIEIAVIEPKTELANSQQELRAGEVYYHLAQGSRLTPGLGDAQGTQREAYEANLALPSSGSWI